MSVLEVTHKTMVGICFAGIAVCIVLLACTNVTPTERKAQDEATQRYKMSCTGRLHDDFTIHRCENEEVVCYMRTDHPFCKFKEAK